jgi:intracellular septation protein A
MPQTDAHNGEMAATDTRPLTPTPSPPGNARPNPQDLKDRREADAQARWTHNRPAILTDIALGLLFFVVAKLSDLTTAALVGAAAGLALVRIQRFVKVDLLGGLALFGIVMLLVSAGFSWGFQDENMVKLKGSILGLAVAALMLGDALLNRGRYFGARLARYILQPVHVRRLALGLGVVGLIMAALNAAVAALASTEHWLLYTTFGDVVISVALFFGVLRFASLPLEAGCVPAAMTGTVHETR